MRTLAIDFGTRRIGLAMSDSAGKWATPHSVVQVSDPQQAIDPIRKLVNEEAVERIVIGLPLNMDGSEGAAVQGARRWADGLSAALEKLAVTIVFVDERLSTFTADQQLIDRKRAGEKLTRKKKRGQLDAMAAAGFLQDYLDGRLRGIKAQ